MQVTVYLFTWHNIPEELNFLLLPLWYHQNLQLLYYLQRECRFGFGIEDWEKIIDTDEKKQVTK